MRVESPMLATGEGIALHSSVLDIPSETKPRYGRFMLAYMIYTTMGRPKPRPGRICGGQLLLHVYSPFN
jgi:hypothetical protein